MRRTSATVCRCARSEDREVDRLKGADFARRALEVAGDFRAITSAVIPDASFLRNAEHRELFLSGLRLAAGEAP
jgi:hypothetical protein